MVTDLIRNSLKNCFIYFDWPMLKKMHFKPQLIFQSWFFEFQFSLLQYFLKVYLWNCEKNGKSGISQSHSLMFEPFVVL